MSKINGYRKLTYIQSSGTQYIDSGLKGNLNTDVEIKVNQIVASTNNTISVFGDNTDNTLAITINLPTDTTSRRQRFGSQYFSNTNTYSLNTDYTIRTNKTSMSVNGTSVGTFNTTTSFATSSNLAIFKFYGNTSTYFDGTQRVYYCKIWDNNTLVRDFIPAERESDNEVGLYDLANDLFYTNSGSGTFTKGDYIYDIETDVSPNGVGTTTGDGEYVSGDTCTLTATASSGYRFGYWSLNGTQVSTSSTYSFSVTSDETYVANFIKTWEITTGVNSSNYGTATGDGTYDDGSSVTLTASPYPLYKFDNWTLSTVQVSTSNPYTFTASADGTYVANFSELYTITLNYDSTLGSATYSLTTTSTINLTATLNSGARFIGWYVNSTQFSTSLSTTYEIGGDTTIEARFEPIYTITTSVVGSGSISYTRGTNENDVEFTCIPNTHYHFSKYVVNGVEYATTPLDIHLTANVSVVCYIDEDDKYHITANTNIDNNSIYLSDNDVYGGTSVTLWARPYPHYNFKTWSDGNTDNPRTIVVNDNVTLIAEFDHEIETSGIYQYRCFVKDQMNLTQAPKSFMMVRTFDISNDLLTTANSTIVVYEVDGDINNGDILVLYNPMGETIYQGVIYSMEDETIRCHQMQNFYSGKWIYNVYPSTYLETEIAYLLGQYAQGKMYGSTYTDGLVAQRLGGITIRSTNSLQVHLPTDTDDDGNLNYTQKDMESFIYSLYQDYGIVFEFTINFSGTNYVDIKVPTYSSLKVGNNNYAIQNLSPVTTIEETNRLIIYAKDHTYRTTYVATSTGIVEQPSSLVGRFNVTNTKIVNSDDAVADLVAKNLPSTMYNHKITFTLLLKNSLYDFSEFKLGMPLAIWYGTDYYGSVLTGHKLSKSENSNPTNVDYTCGLVRTALTKKLSLGVVNNVG